jgi:hypothetical protein
MRKFLSSLIALAAVAATSVSFATETVTREHGIGGDCAKIRGHLVVEGPVGAGATGPGWVEIKGVRLEGTYSLLAIPDVNAVRVDPATGVVQFTSHGYGKFESGDNVIFSINVTLYTSRPDTPGLFDVYGASVSGPAFMASPDYPSWGSGAFAYAQLSMQSRGTFQQIGDMGYGEFTIEDGTICNVDWKALK